MVERGLSYSKEVSPFLPRYWSGTQKLILKQITEEVGKVKKKKRGWFEVVADSNVLISALWMVSHDVLKLAENKNIRLCVSPSIIEEVADVLARPKLAGRIEELRTTPDEIIESLLSIVEIVHPRHSFKVTADPDDMILECAVQLERLHCFWWSSSAYTKIFEIFQLLIRECFWVEIAMLMPF